MRKLTAHEQAIHDAVERATIASPAIPTESVVIRTARQLLEMVDAEDVCHNHICEGRPIEVCRECRWFGPEGSASL